MDMTLNKDSPAAGYEVLSFGPFRLDPVRRVLLEAGKARRVGSRALEILVALAERAGQTVTKNELIARVWPDSVVQEATLRVHIAALRKVLGDGESGTRYVENFSGRGYRFVAEVRAHHGALLSAIPDRPTSDSSGEPPVAERHWETLPTRLTRMIGRTQVVNSLAERVPLRRFVTIVGPGGIGKTTVALAVADKLNAGYPDGVRFIDLASQTDPEGVADTLTAALGVPMATGDRLLEVISFLQDKQMLIVLDNCEHVIEVAARVAERLLKGAPDVHLLATSREPLRADSENVHRLGPLEAPPVSSTLTRREALEFPAIQLFVERAIASHDTFELCDADAPIVAVICRRLDGNPLAIELAAARTDLFDTRALAARLDDCLLLLTRGRRTAPPRHQTLRATLEWSYELLSPVEQLMLGRLAVFAGGFTMDGAIKLVADDQIRAADVFDVLTNLVAKSLVTADITGEQVVYRLLDTPRIYALEKLQSAGECTQIKGRNARIWSPPTALEFIGRSYDEHSGSSAYSGSSCAVRPLVG